MPEESFVMEVEKVYENDPVGGYQSGWTIHAPWQISRLYEKAAGDLIIDRDYLGRVAATYNPAELVATPTSFVTMNDVNIPETKIKLDALQFVAVMQKQVAWMNAWPAVTTDIIDGVSGFPDLDLPLVCWYYYFYELGLRGEMYPLYNDDFTDFAADIEEAIQGLDDKDHALIPTKDYIGKRLIRQWYDFGIQDRGKVPDLSADARSTANELARVRAIWRLLWDRMRPWVEGEILCGANSDMFQMARLNLQNKVSRQDLPGEFKSLTVDSSWEFVDRPGKTDIIGSGWNTATLHYHVLQDSNVSDQAIRSGDEHRIAEWQTECIMDGRAVAFAHNHSGGGIYTKHHDMIHYAILWNLAGDDEDVYPDHPTIWYVGLNLCIAQDFELVMADMNWWSDVEKLKKRKYWTWVDIDAAVGSNAVKGSISKTFHGLIGSDAMYRPMQILFHSTGNTRATPYGFVDLISRDPTDCHTNGTMKSEFHGQIWMIPFLHPYVHKNMNLYFWDEWGMDEVASLFEMGLMFSTSSTLTSDRYTLVKARYVDVVQVKDTDRVEAKIYALEDVARFENFTDCMDHTTWKASAIKYGMELSRRVPKEQWWSGPSRLHGINGARIAFIARVFDWPRTLGWYTLKPVLSSGKPAETAVPTGKPVAVVVSEANEKEVNSPNAKEVTE